MEWSFADKTYVILISGKAGVGKTTFANFVVKELNEKNLPIYVSKGSFARGVKIAACTGFNWDNIKNRKGRRLLQQIGAIGREYNENLWVESLLNSLTITPNILIIDDWRFPNEEIYFLRRPDLYSLFRIRIEARKRESLRGTSEYNDISETSLVSGENYLNNNLKCEYYDLIIDNNDSTLEDLNSTAKYFVDRFILEKGVKDG